MTFLHHFKTSFIAPSHAILWLISPLLIAFPNPVAAQDSATTSIVASNAIRPEIPSPSALRFHPAALGLPERDRENLVNVLVGLAANYLDLQEEDPLVCARALSLANRVSPESDIARTGSRRYSEGIVIDVVPGLPDDGRTLLRLVAQMGLTLSKEAVGEDEQMLALYLINLSRSILPKDTPGLGQAFNLLAKQKFSEWDFADED